MVRYAISLLLFLLFFHNYWVSGQTNDPIRFRNDISISDGSGKGLTNGWAGGMNAPQWSSADFNGDGLSDLFVFDRSDEYVSVFFAVRKDEKIEFRWQPSYIGTFPPLKRWSLIRDLNCDGIPELLSTDSIQNLVYYLGYKSEGKLLFSRTPVTPRFKFLEYEGGPVLRTPQLFIPVSDISAFEDMDFDGDTDVLANNSDGMSVMYYRNHARERFNRCDIFDLELVSFCWGHFSEIYDGTSYDVQMDLEPCRDEYKTSHVGGSLTPINLNGDTLMDCIISDAGLNTQIALINGGTRKIARITGRDNEFPRNTLPIDQYFFPASYLVHLNNDRNVDLIASPNDGQTGEDYYCAWRYDNVSKDSAVKFEFREKDFLVSTMADAGSGAYPVMLDYNKDGKTDLAVAYQTRFVSALRSKSNIILYKNIGSNEEPVFLQVADSLLITSNMTNPPLFVAPAFIDMDNDGDDDLLCGELTGGSLSYWRNEQTSGDSVPYFVLQNRNYFNYDPLGSTEAVPVFHDTDGDTDKDLIIGTGTGRLIWAENTGTSERPFFRLGDSNWGRVRVSDNDAPLLGKAAPVFVDGNGDGKPELWVANASGKIYIYSICNQDSFPVSDTLFAGLPFTRNLKVCVYESKNDSLGLFMGTRRGGLMHAQIPKLTFLHPDSIQCARANQPSEPDTALIFKVFPIPADEKITIQSPQKAEAEFFNLLGQKTAEIQLNKGINEVSTKDWQPGVYLLRSGKERRYILVFR